MTASIALTKHCFTTLFCIFLFSFICTSQITPAKSFSLEEDNNQAQINVIYKNNQGYIYAGTNSGLYKFDGTRFHRIYFENRDYSDTVTAIFQDRSDKYWIGFKSGRIANIFDGKLQFYNPEEGTPHKRITAFLQDKEDKIWFSTNGEGIYYLKNTHLYLVNKENGLTDENVAGLALADNGDILAATDQGISCIHVTKNNTITSITPKQGLPDYIVSVIINAGDNNFWMGMQDKGFCLYDHASGKITVPSGEEWKYGQINSLLQAQGHLWIATQDAGLFKLKLSGTDLSKITDAGRKETINYMLEDNQSNIWLSAPSSGLIRTSGESVKLFPLPKETLFEHIHSVLADRNNNIWVTNFQNELLRSSLYDQNQPTQRIHLKGITEKTDITSLYQDKNGNIWIGSMGKGVFILDPETKQYRVFNENPRFKDASILSISGRDRDIFISSLQGAIMISLPLEYKNINQKYPYTDLEQAGMASNYIYSIFEDSKGHTWFATDGNGLFHFQKGNFTNYDSKDNIKDDRIYSITEDRLGNIWFSTASAGIYKFDGTSFRNYGLREGLSELNISAVKTDKRGNITIIHKKGIDILDPLTNNISYINNNRGVSGLNVEDLGAVAQDSSGNIFVSSENGIVLYSPEINIVQQPKTIIESIQLFLNVLKDSTPAHFGHEENNFTFNYTGLYYTDPELVYYQYKLEGFDTSWILTKDRSRTFPKLDPGKYTFRIQSSLNRSFINANEASYSFVIRQAFYKQWWFILICVLLIAGLLYWYIRNRETGLKKLERLQQEKIQFRFEVLRNQVNPHFLFNSFNTLISTIEDDPKMAVEYVEQLSDFFRNIVNYRDKDVISLKEELGLLQTYLFLQKKRYGENLRLTIMISEDDMVLNHIPPLTLQLLMENAIKHNSVTKEMPLRITIEITDKSFLTIKNNINVRRSAERGAGMGLQNIINRYHLLTSKEVKVSNNGSYFIVSLPLINLDYA